MAYTVKQSNPAAATPADLYTVPAGKEAVISTLAVCEHGDVATRFRVLVRPAGAAAAAVHRLVYDAPVAGLDTVFLTIGAALAAGDVVTVEAATADVTFTAFVSETEV
jgi:hypothetical protein